MLAKLVVSAGFFLVGVCGQTTKTASSVTFSATKYPLETEVFKFTNMHTESIATVNYNDGTSTTSAFTYKPWFKTGELVPNGEGGFSLSGGYYDSKMAPIIDTSGPAPRQFYSGWYVRDVNIYDIVSSDGISDSSRGQGQHGLCRRAI